MKKILFIVPFLVALLFFSCEKQNLFNPEPPDELPPATTVGANTFGCLVNGEVWRPYTENLWENAIYAKHDRGWVGCDQLLVSGTKNYIENEVNIYQSMSVNTWCPKLGENELSAGKVYRDLNGCGFYELDTLSPYFLIITKLDTINNIASGTFEFTAIGNECGDTVKITQGRFDVDSRL